MGADDNVRHRSGLSATVSVIKKPRYLVLLFFTWILSLWLFVYITNLNLFYYIWVSSGLTLGEKASFTVDSFTSILTSLSNLVALSIFIFSFFAALNITMLIHLLRNRQKLKLRSVGGTGSVAALVGSHCIACGGSLLAPFISVIAGSGAFFSVARINTAITISVLINIVAIILIARSTLKIASHTAMLASYNN
jgi:hypothetical protein